MTKKDFLEKIKAGLVAGAIGTTLAGTTATLSSCTPEEQEFIEAFLDDEEVKQEESKAAQKEEEAKKEEEYQATNTTTVEAIGDNMGTETTPVENTTNEEQPIQTSANTNTETPSKTTTANGGSYTPTTTQVQVPVTTKAQTTAKTTTTTKKTTATTTTAKPVVTTTTTTTIPAPTYEYKLENITQSAEVFNYFAEQLKKEILNGEEFQLVRMNGEKYWTNGKYESRVVLFILNEDENYAPGVLTRLFENFSTQDYEDGILFLHSFASLQKHYDKEYINFETYSLDKQTGKYLNDIENQWQKALEIDDCTQLDAALEDFFENEQLVYKNAPYFYSLGIPGACSKSKYMTQLTLGENNEELQNVREQIKEKVK